jgi:uncharacterized protein (TIGR02444 family)
MSAEKSSVSKNASSGRQNEFWDYSLHIYARPQVAAACLKLQDEAGADVNILLLCLWLASKKAPPLSPDFLKSIDQTISPWRNQVILPLRQARRNLAGFAASPENLRLKSQILKAELEAEHRNQLDLEAHATRLLASSEYRAQKKSVFAPRQTAEISLGHYLELTARGQQKQFADIIGLLAENSF